MTKTRDLANFTSAGNPLADGDLNDLTSTAAELNTLDGITATVAELNILDGVTANATELNYLDGVTSPIQTQLDNISVTNATLTKSFVSGETSTIALSQAITSGAPVVSVTKEVPQTGVTENAWDVGTTGANYTRHDTAYDTTLTPGILGFQDIDGASYDSVSLSVSSVDNQPYAIAFNDDGTKLFYLGSDTDSVYQYSLSTAFDLSTASYDSVSFSVFTETGTIPYDLAFSADGTKMYVSDDGADSLYQYSLSTAFDLSTASYDSVSFSIASQGTGPQGFCFNNDGSKLYVFAGSNDSFFEYNLSPSYDLSTASYSGNSLNVGSEDTVARGLVFNTDGTKMYVIGDANNSVFQYSLSTAFDLSTASYDSVSFSVASQDTSPYDIAFNNDGTKMYIVGQNTDTIYQYTIPSSEVLTLGTGSFASTDVGKTIEGNGGEAILTATDGSYSLVTAFNDSSTISAGDWSMYATVFDATNGLELSSLALGFTDIDGASYDSVSFSVAFQDTEPYDIAFNNDGTKMYFLGEFDDSVYQYSLSTGFDLSTASYDSVSFSVLSQDGSPYGIAFNNDGTKMYVLGDVNRSIFQYSLSTAFDLSTASYDSVSFSVNSQDGSPVGLAFNNDGTKMYMLGLDNDSVFQYSLSTAYDLSTTSYDSVSFSVAGQETSTYDIAFNNDGTKMYMVGYASGIVHQYSLSTGFDLSTTSYDSVSFDVSSQDTNPIGMAFNSLGTKMYIVGYTNDTVYQYTTGLSVQPTAQYFPAITNAGGQIDSTYWTDINSMTTDQIAGDGQVYYAVSTDGRTTWSVIDDTNGVRPIVRDNGGTWEYNSNATYGSTTWTSATTNAELDALQEALSVTANQMDKTQLEAVTDANHYTLGNSLDLMIALYLGSESASIPSSDGVSINYDANVKNEGAVLGTDYDYDFPANDVVRITSNATQNLKVRIV